MATSYANAGGTGDRTATITTTSAPGDLFGAGNLAKLINGDLTANDCWFNVRSSAFMKFQFGSQKVIDTFRWKQSNGNPHGVWKWFGSNDDISYDPLGNDFTLEGVSGGAFNEITEPAGNTVGYLYYSMVQQSGGTGSGPFLYEIEFKIDAPAAPSGTLAATDGADVAALTGSISTTGTLGATDSSDAVSMVQSASVTMVMGATDDADLMVLSDDTRGTLGAIEEPDTVFVEGIGKRRPYPVICVLAG